MLDRRRAARFVVLIVAALAVAGTSQMPTPGPSQRLDLNGTIRLSAENPVAIQPLDVAVEAGRLDTLAFAASLGGLPDDGTVVASIEVLAGGPTGGSNRQFGGATPQPARDAVTANATFRDPCAGACPGAYGLVITWLGAPRGGTAEVAWSLHATAVFSATGGGASPAAVGVTITAADARVPESSSLTAATAGEPVHLTEADRFRAWSLELTRAAPDLPNGAPRALTQVRLDASAVRTAGEPFRGDAGKDRREENRRDPPVQVRLVSEEGLVWRWAGEGPLVFDPFRTCASDRECERTVTIELAWADGRADAAYDAEWRLDIATIAAEGAVEPIKATVTEVSRPDLATATAAGSFTVDGQIKRGESIVIATGAPAFANDSPWAAVGLPVRGRLTAHVVAEPGSSLPPDATFRIFAHGTSAGPVPVLGSAADVRIDEEVTFAFEPTMTCAAGRPQGCQVHITIGSFLATPNPNQAPANVAYRVEWTLELGAAVTDDGTFSIAVDPAPSP